MKKRMFRHRKQFGRSPVGQGLVEFLITEHNEITTLFDQPAIPRVGVNPSVAGPGAGGVAAPAFIGDPTDTGLQRGLQGFKEALRRGGTYVNVSPLSDLPVIGVLDASDDVDFTFVRYNPRIIWIGCEPVLIERPIIKPVLIPPCARYYWGHRNAVDLFPLCGIGEAGVSPLTGFVAFYLSLQYGATPQGWDIKNDGQLSRYRLITNVVGPVIADGVNRHVSFASLIFGQDLPSVAAYGPIPLNHFDDNIWLLYKHYQSAPSSGVLLSYVVAKATSSWLNCGNKVYVRLLVRDDGVAQVSVLLNSFIEFQAGGFYE